MRLSDAGVRRARVRAQGLGSVFGRPDVAEVVSRVVGVQAQDRRAAALSVRARSRGLVAADVTRALAEDRSVVLTWSLRGTRHLHHHEDVGWIVGLVGPRFARPGRRAEQLGIAGETGEQASRALREALATDGPLTRPEIKRRLAPLGIDPSGQGAIHVIARAALEGTVCVVPDEEGEERYVLTADWVGATGPVDLEQASAELARRHLAAFAPATVDDFATWSGLGAPGARRAWAMIAPEMSEVATSRGAAWALTRHADQARAASRRPAGVRLLGGFDALLLGYVDRALLLAPEYARRVSTGGGMVKATVLSDGEVAGTWRGGGPAPVEVDLFRGLSDAESAALDAEVADAGRFLLGR